ncbi:MAG: SIMPL domain-containing protein [Candidatus Accumulibacter sp.]|jgi:predicted secreted protein|nr:SIMPL domain-containing protein [Accumulibacter sp.]
MRVFVFCIAALFSTLISPWAGAAPAKPAARLSRVDISVTAEAYAANDRFRAVVVAADAGKTPEDIAPRIDAGIAETIMVVAACASIEARNGNTSSIPNFSDGKIKSWTMSSELFLESPDVAQLSELLGKLPPSIGISRIEQYPGPKNREKAENTAILEGIAAFKKRAKLVADTFGKPYRIARMQVNTQNQLSSRPRATNSALSHKSSAPIEAGETRINVVVSGQIEIGR